MTDRAPPLPPAPALADTPAGGFRSLLVPVDLSPASDRVIGRIALLPLAEGARITLLHVLPEGLTFRAQERAEGDARTLLRAEADALARELPRSVTIHHAVRVGAAAAEIARHADAVAADLVVMGRAGGEALRELFFGSTAERVVRQARLPVLVVRLRPRTPYRRPAVALALDDASRDAVITLLRVIPPPRPAVSVIHVCDAPLKALAYSSLHEDDIEACREARERKAEEELAQVLTAALAEAKVPQADAPAWKTRVRHGPPRAQIEKAAKKADADLLALGTHGHSGVVHAFLGTVAGDVLRAVACDVLVVPPREAASGGT
ncbi:universal stress protein [Sorangium sp. So ce1097]|uniref:universal stress protein n=1 Tax=Sorangium sp. So ce1097 TaxID=3133330 RepID=UPI003F5E0A8C